MSRKVKALQLLVEQNGRHRRVAKLTFGRGEFYLVPEQVGCQVACGTWRFGVGETKASVDVASGSAARAEGFHLSFHRSGRVHARHGLTEYARRDACPLDQLPSASHVGTIEIVSIDRLPLLGRAVKRTHSARPDWVFRCPPTMTRGRLPLFLSLDPAGLPESELNRFQVGEGSRPLFLGTRLMGQTDDWGLTPHDLLVLGGWDVRTRDPQTPDGFVWVSVTMPRKP